MPVPAVRFPEPEGFDELPKKERLALRRAWRNDPKTQDAKAKAREERREAFNGWVDDFVLSPVIPLVMPAIKDAVAALDAPLGPDDEDDLVDEVFDKLVKKADAFADFDELKKAGPIGALAAAGAEKLSDELIASASDRLEYLIRKALADFIAAADRTASQR